MKIEVTQKHIDEAGSDCNSCPVALAVKEAVKHDAVEAGQFTITIGSLSHETPSRVTRFMDKYDNGESVKPFTFELPI